jgi:hypothetical protein
MTITSSMANLKLKFKMKLALILLSICVAISHQQYYHPRMMMEHPWMSPFAQ